VPELPEVETTRRGIEPHVAGETIAGVILRERRLRWPISAEVAGLSGRRVIELGRRGKYILMRLDRGHLIWHLGMSGSMRMLPVGSPEAAHEHVELEFGNGMALKFRDPRRFGALLYCARDPLEHPLLRSLGPEPLGDDFDAAYLYRHCRQRSAAIKNVIMNSQVVVGVGNIYASEALFRAGIRPARAARRISRARIATLVDAIRATLAEAIGHGGTTLQDFTQADGKPGYFRHELQVYANRDTCKTCQTPIKQVVLGQRASYFCPHCQT